MLCGMLCAVSHALPCPSCACAFSIPMVSEWQPWTGNFETRNYVKYQRPRPDLGQDRSNPAAPNSCLVVATAVTCVPLRGLLLVARWAGDNWMWAPSPSLYGH